VFSLHLYIYLCCTRHCTAVMQIRRNVRSDNYVCVYLCDIVIVGSRCKLLIIRHTTILGRTRIISSVPYPYKFDLFIFANVFCPSPSGIFLLKFSFCRPTTDFTTFNHFCRLNYTYLERETHSFALFFLC